MQNLLFMPLIVGIASLGYSLFVGRWIRSQKTGTDQMQHVAGIIARGASAFLKAEYKTMAFFVVISTIPLAYLGFCTPYMVPSMAATYIMGAFVAGLAGYISMRMATCTNVRTAHVAGSGLFKAFRMALSGGSVIGIMVVGLVLLGISSICIGCFYYVGENQDGIRLAVQLCLGFALGSQVYALFARVAGGVYTKAADVGADMVGKLEESLPEDDVRNPAVIADNVGDNVGDNMGSGADIFSSLTSMIVAVFVLSPYIYGQTYPINEFLLPVYITAIGLFSSLLLMVIALLVSVHIQTKKRLLTVFKRLVAFVFLGSIAASLFYKIKVGQWLNSLLYLVFFIVFATVYKLYSKKDAASQYRLTVMVSFIVIFGFLCDVLIKMVASDSGFVSVQKIVQLPYSSLEMIFIGIVTSQIINFFIEWVTNKNYWPVKFIIQQSATSAANNLIAGLSIGMLSTVVPVGILASSIGFSYVFGSWEGVVFVALGSMTMAGLQLAIDAFGPIADNAGGIVEMSGLQDRSQARNNTDVLDAEGNTTAAMGKGFSMVAATFSTILLFTVYTRVAGIHSISLSDPLILAGLLAGVMVPYLFSAITIGAVGRASLVMIDEVRRQFKAIPGLLEGKASPDYDRCITIATKAALKNVWLPGFLSIGLPTLIGYFFGTKILGAYVVGITVSGILLGFFQCNAGGAWDNAKKAFEKGVEIGGKVVTKDSQAYHAAVVGDTVGDPLKDTSGPSINILIKLTSLIALIMAYYL